MNDNKKKILDKDELPTYTNHDELPHVPVSMGVKGSIGKTGEWRIFRPIVDLKKCNKCGLCYIYCPEGTIIFSKDKGPSFDYVYCKGCGICSHECPIEAIKMEREIN
ncbi:MAG: 4Fe-4S binding protein [Promethearchaeota archaeon]